MYHWVNDSIAYLNLRSASVDNIYDNYDAIKTASAIILDLRSYPYTDIISPLTNMFVPPNSFFAYSTYSDTRFPGMLRYHRSSSNKIGSVNYYKGRIIILVNEWTRSFSEYLTMALQVNPRSITVGNSTSGSDGNVSLFTFPGKVLTTYSGIGIYYLIFLQLNELEYVLIALQNLVFKVLKIELMLRMKGLLLSQKVELTRLLQLKLDLNKDFDIFFEFHQPELFDLLLIFKNIIVFLRMGSWC